jgi:ankyrin repeat protein
MSFHNIKKVSQIKELTRLGHDINKKDLMGNTALHKMTQKDNLELVNGLLEYGASANITNITGEVPLFCAKSEKVANCLINKTKFPYSKNIIGIKLLDANPIVQSCLLKKVKNTFYKNKFTI